MGKDQLLPIGREAIAGPDEAIAIPNSETDREAVDTEKCPKGMTEKLSAVLAFWHNKDFLIAKAVKKATEPPEVVKAGRREMEAHSTRVVKKMPENKAGEDT
ncbi:hypothetical protein NDU88_003427 [Pleurodeles waltl]|uniref:Uncharacterized protein n=1 Tax=Pleurodeles waltl TaxID=8319 RepID=A0AAV7M700_PLEWA|nr:hypothetical protein NDU88_003427 [Pleurodeles waltl]